MMMTLSLANICKLDTTFMIKHVGNMHGEYQGIVFGAWWLQL